MFEPAQLGKPLAMFCTDSRETPSPLRFPDLLAFPQNWALAYRTKEFLMKRRGTANGASQRSNGTETYPLLARDHSREESIGRQGAPSIDVSECDGTFNIYADFNLLTDSVEAPEPSVEFARQGVVITHGMVQRYIPIPTDGEIERATVKNAGGIVRISVPTADLGHRWRSITMW